MVKSILKEERIETLANVVLTLKSKVITVEGPKGKLIRSFANVPVQMNAEYDDKKNIKAISVRVWFAKSKQKSAITSICKHIHNMMVGVTKGYSYVMKYGYNLTPMQPVAIEDGKVLQVTNYLGEKIIRKIRAAANCSIITSKDTDTKKEIQVIGIDNECVGRTCALINQNCKPKDKDRRKFRDGIYIFSRGLQG
jgi:large subunit ribosomal protein L9e